MLITIKTKKPDAHQSESFRREVSERTARILATEGDRVLVVFGKKDASIYYEGQALPRRPPRAGSHRGPKAA